MTYYTYNNTPFTRIFSTTDADAASVTLTNFKENGTPLVYDTANGSVSTQNSIINYTASPSNYFSNLSSYYIDYTLTTEYTILVDEKCKEIRVLLCGAGGSGGAGAGDTKGERGWSGGGGGGGAYYYYNTTISTATTLKLSIGAGGAPVSGSGSGNSGAPGNPGEPTILYAINGTTILSQANGGGGGGGGLPDGETPGGTGGTGSALLISAGNNGTPGTPDRSVVYIAPGGNSGWVNMINNIGGIYPKCIASYPSGIFGNGGAGTRGEYDPQTISSEPGQNGWARIYFLY